MSLNKVMLIGNVGKDPEIRYLDQGVCTAQISLATSTPGYTLQNGTAVPERTEWHSVYLWRRLAEVVERYVHKGDKLYIEGEVRYRTFTDKKGFNHKVTEIWASNMEMLTPKPQSANVAPTPGVAPTVATQTPQNPFPSTAQTAATNGTVDPQDKCPF